MIVGIATFFPWRPHVHQAMFLSKLLRDAGHKVEFLTCDGQLNSCYQKKIVAQKGGRFPCVRCVLGGVRSFESENVSRLRSAYEKMLDAENWCMSSASTLYRGESEEQLNSIEVNEIARELAYGASQTFVSVRHWLEEKGINQLLVFNGRMDVSRAAYEAARSIGVSVITMERPWFGDGIQLYPNESCIGLLGVNRLIAEFADRPLTSDQAFIAAGLICDRLLRSNQREWRAYNVDSISASWPVADAYRKVLVLPGSRNEVYGHPDWSILDDDRTQSFDRGIAALGVRSTDVVVRCHPNWAESIAGRSGELIEQWYIDWCVRKGYTSISAADKRSTMDLIQHADVILVAGGSAALEAALLGKQVVSVGPSAYEGGGFVDECRRDGDTVVSDWELSRAEHSLIQESRRRYVLRAVYTIYGRATSYVNYVRCNDPTSYTFFEGAPARRVEELFKENSVVADDNTFSSDSSAESRVLRLVEEGDWQAISKISAEVRSSKYLGKRQQNISRRLLFRPIDIVRKLGKRGDR